MWCEKCGGEIDKETSCCKRCGAYCRETALRASQDLSDSHWQQEEPAQETAKKTETRLPAGAGRAWELCVEKTTKLGKGVRGFFDRKVKPLYRKADKAAAPYADRVIALVDSKLPQLHRAEEKSPEKKRAVLYAALLGVIVALVMLVVLICSLSSPALNGRWIVAQQGDSSGSPIIAQFDSRSISFFVQTDDGLKLYREGRLKTYRSEDGDVLEITYSDGTVKTLYYEIDGKRGTFTDAVTGRIQIWSRSD